MKARGYGRFWGVVKLFAAWVVIAAAVRAGALDPKRDISQYIQTVWTTDAGLPQTSIYAVAQTGDGYLWVGTESGLARFDGVRFTVYNRRNTKELPTDYIARLLGARDGSLWIGTDSGLVHMKDGAWTIYTVHDGLSSNDIHALFEAGDGSLWVGTAHGLDRLKDGRIAAYGVRDGLPGNTVTDLKADSAGDLWIATDAGLARFDGKSFSAYTAARGLANTALSALAIAPDGAVWMAGAHGQMARLVQGHIDDERQKGMSDDISALHFDHEGNLWIGFESSGLARLHNGTLSLYGTQNGLPGDTVETFFEDSQHDLWVGMFDGGLVELRDGAFATYGKAEGLSSNIGWCGLEAKDGSIWMATSTGGVDRILPDGTIRHYTNGERKSNETVHSMLETRDGAIWLGQRHGVLTRFLNGRFDTFQYERSSKSSINSLLEDPDGSLIVGTYGAGAARFNIRGTNGQFAVIRETGEIPAMALGHDGTLWLGTDGEGVIGIRNGVEVAKITKANGLLSDHILALYMDAEGVLWVGSSSGGLNRVQDGKITPYTPEQGLFDSTVGNILEDKSGNLWMGSDQGVSRVPKGELNDIAMGRIGAIHGVVYGTADGLRSRETMQGGTGTASKGPDGRLWFSTMKGLSVVDPARALGDDEILRAQISELSINGKAADPDQGIFVGPGASRLEIRFTSPSFIAPRRIHFRYMLEGFDHWSASSTRRFADYTNLPPGRYRFLVEASRDGIEWGGDAQPMNLTVVPPWYRSRTAISSFVFAGILLAWLFVETRTRSLKRRRNDLERQVVERTAQLEIEKQGLMRAREALQFQAAHDSLTGLWSRGAILEQLARELERARRQQTVLSVVVGDLDHFKVINDTYGHLCGDVVLRESAHRLVGLMRGYDAVGRYGGEEFLLVLPGYDAAKSPARSHELVDVLAAQPFDWNGTEINVRCSFGVTVTRPWLDHSTIDDLIRRADKALYEAKRNGRNRVEFDSTSTPAKAER